MEHKSSWKDDIFLASKEINCILLNLKVQYDIHKSLSAVCLLN